MNLIALSVRDNVADAFGVPVFVQTIGLGVRGFRDALSSENEMSRHPEDYDLFHVGNFDLQEGRFTTLPNPVLLVKGGSVKHEEPANVS